MRLTGPTDAVALARLWALSLLVPNGRDWHVVEWDDQVGYAVSDCGEWHFGHGAQYIRASRADILGGAIKPLCPECRASILEVRDGESAAGR